MHPLWNSTLDVQRARGSLSRMSLTSTLLDKALQGESCTREELLALSREPLEELCQAANAIREHFCGNVFDLCTIINGRSGKCSENCRYCAQSAHYSTAVEEYPLLSDEALLAGARYNDEKGILRYSIVTSGKRLTDADVEQLCASYRHIAARCGISLCASHGLISKKHCEQLKAAGVSRYHNNLETSRRNFPNVCTTHTYDDKIQTIKWAMEAGLEVCSGGIMGLGETLEDRIDMYRDIASLGIKSTPINFLTPIPGTPYADMIPLGEEDQLRIVALVRFILPDGFVRIAAGRNTMQDHGRKIFMSGANAAISGDMLTTSGVTIREDLAMLAELGYEVRMK